MSNLDQTKLIESFRELTLDELQVVSGGGMIPATTSAATSTAAGRRRFAPHANKELVGSFDAGAGRAPHAA